MMEKEQQKGMSELFTIVKKRSLSSEVDSSTPNTISRTFSERIKNDVFSVEPKSIA
jgi:hypothetical protein